MMEMLKLYALAGIYIETNVSFITKSSFLPVSVPNYYYLHGVVQGVVMHYVVMPQTHKNITFKTKAIELAADIIDEAMRASAKVKFGNEITDHGVEGFIVSVDCFRSQHMLPQETPHRLPLLPLTRNTQSN